MAKDQVAKGVDFLWDGFLNSFRTFQLFQDDVEKKTLQTFNYQKEVLDSTVSAFSSIEEESKKASKEWQEKVQSSFSEISNIEQFEQVTKWFESVREITEKAQSLAWKPSNAILELFTESQNQWEATVKKALELQKQERVETLNKIEELTEQLKETHKKLLAVHEA